MAWFLGSEDRFGHLPPYAGLDKGSRGLLDCLPLGEFEGTVLWSMSLYNLGMKLGSLAKI